MMWLKWWFFVVVLHSCRGHRFFPAPNAKPTYRPTVVVHTYNRENIHTGPAFAPVFVGASSSSGNRILPPAAKRVVSSQRKVSEKSSTSTIKNNLQIVAKQKPKQASRLVEIVESPRKLKAKTSSLSLTEYNDGPVKKIPIITKVPKFTAVDLETDLAFVDSLYDKLGFEQPLVSKNVVADSEKVDNSPKDLSDEFEELVDNLLDDLPEVHISSTNLPAFDAAPKDLMKKGEKKTSSFSPIIIKVPSSQITSSSDDFLSHEYDKIEREEPPAYLTRKNQPAIEDTFDDDVEDVDDIDNDDDDNVDYDGEPRTLEELVSRSKQQITEPVKVVKDVIKRPPIVSSRPKQPSSSGKHSFGRNSVKPLHNGPKPTSNRKNSKSSNNYFGAKAVAYSYKPIKPVASYPPIVRKKSGFKPSKQQFREERQKFDLAVEKDEYNNEVDDLEDDRVSLDLGDEDDFEDIFEQILKTNGVEKPRLCQQNGELFADERNCRKYYKCAQGRPSHQDCPGSLIFHRGLKICNWPDATECIEDPDAPLPEISSSDRHPAKVRRPPPTFNAIEQDQPSRQSVPSSQRPRPDFDVPSPGGPSYREAIARENLLTSEYPLFKEVKKTVRTLETELVEKITPGAASNPDNVKRVEFILSEDNYEDLFPRRHATYTYKRLLQAIGKFPAVCGYVGTEEKSDKICRKTLATMFAHFTQETGNHNPSDKEFEEWRQGLSQVRESGCTDTGPGCGYNLNCEDKDSITKKWACGKDKKGEWRKYFGRGAKQLSYNFNYGQFSQAMFGDGRLLLDFPDFVATTWLNLASATWFYTTPQPPKPSMLHVIDGTWVPNSEDRRNGIEPGFGATINIINGGLECNTKDGRETKQALNRIAYYKQFAWYLYVDYDDETLGCAKQKQFTAGGAGAIPIYWDKDWAHPTSCKLVPYQTAFSALVPGEYVDCVEENFNVKIERPPKQ